MNTVSSVPYAAEINTIRENYDVSNPVVAEIIKAKEQRLRVLYELKQQQEEEFADLKLQLPHGVNDRPKATPVKKRRKVDTNFPQISIRRSERLRNSPSVEYGENDRLYREEVPRSQIVRPPLDYGPVPGVEVGQHWETRMECSMYGVHRPTVAGIHGGPKGAYSIALSGGYPEDVDEGDSFLYTGAGGRDLKGTVNKPKNLRTAPQTKDQQLEGTNLSLVKSIETKLPIRVIRGYKSPSIFAPETGYRYDGLYQVVDYWEDVGKTGFRIYRYKMQRMKDQAPPPWETTIKTHRNKREVRKPNENSDDEGVDLEDDGGEFKENIKPLEKYDENVIGDHIPLDGPVEDVDTEIEMCIKFICKTASAVNGSDLSQNLEEVEFYGWD